MVTNHHSSCCLTRPSGFFHSISSPPRDARNVTGCTGMLGGLAGSLTKVEIYPTYTIHCKRLWSMPALILGLSSIRWWTTQLTYKQLKLYWLKVPKITLGTCKWTNKEHFSVRMYSHSTRGTEVATTEGQWLFSKLPECSAPKTQTTAPRLVHTLLIYPLPYA